MSAHWIMTWPLVGVVYALGAAGCAVWAIRRKANRLLWPLSGLIFSIAILNAYAEEWPTLKQFRFEYAVPILIVLFVLPYRSFCLRLIERTGLRPGFVKEQYSFLLLLYAGLVAMAIVVPFFARDENPAYMLFAFIVFVCALHVPMFAFGRSKIASFVTRSGTVWPEAPPDISWGFFATAMAILGIPLVLTLIVQAVVHDDYRLFTVDAVLTAIIFSLLVISRRGQFKEPVSERQANHGAGGGSLSQSL
jgi:hypothetical protein